MKPPIIVCGLRDSWVGHTAALLAQNPAQRLLPELNLFVSDTLESHQLLSQRSQDGLGDGLLRFIAHTAFSGDDEHSLTAARNWLWRRSAWACNDLLRQFINTSDQQLVIPDRLLGWRPDYIQRLLQLEDFVLVHVTRHPIEHGLELVANLAQEAFVAPEWKDHHLSPEGHLDPQIAWLRFHHNLRRHLQDKPAYIHLPIEDLQRQPLNTLQQLAEQFAWSRQPLSLAHSPDSPFLQPGHSQAPMGMEKAAMLQPLIPQDIRPLSRLDSPAEWLPARNTLHPDVRQFAATLGYE